MALCGRGRTDFWLPRRGSQQPVWTLPALGLGRRWLGWRGWRRGPALGPLDTPCGGPWPTVAGGCALSCVSWSRGGGGGRPPPQLRPQQREAGRPDVSPSCWLTSLNPSFLPCKMGTEALKLVGCVTSAGSHGSRSCLLRDSLGVAWAPGLWSHLLLTASLPYPCPRPCPQSQRESD